MSLNKIAACAWGVIVAGGLVAAPDLYASEFEPQVETAYARIAGGAGFGYCEFTRVGHRVSTRVHVAGMGYGNIGTAWIFVDGVNVGRLDGTIATDTGDAAFLGSFSAARRAELKIDIRDHRVSIKSIGNAPNDAVADDTLMRELTTPAAYKMGTCSTTFE